MGTIGPWIDGSLSIGRSSRHGEHHIRLSYDMPTSD